MKQVSWLNPKDCSTALTQKILDKAKARKYSCLKMPSGAGHDTQFLAELTDAGLILFRLLMVSVMRPTSGRIGMMWKQVVTYFFDCIIDSAQ